jgi:hypothetical protein
MAYDADEPGDERQFHMFIGVRDDRAVAYAMMERRLRVSRCSWDDYDQNTAHAVTVPGGMWSISMVWVSHANRRQGWIRRVLDVARRCLGFGPNEFGWFTPFSESGEALARHLCPRGIFIAK